MFFIGMSVYQAKRFFKQLLYISVLFYLLFWFFFLSERSFFIIIIYGSFLKLVEMICAHSEIVL